MMWNSKKYDKMLGNSKEILNIYKCNPAAHHFIILKMGPLAPSKGWSKYILKINN